MQRASVVAWDDERHVVETRARYAAKRDVLLPVLAALGWEVVASDATMYLWVAVPDAEAIRRVDRIDAATEIACEKPRRPHSTLQVDVREFGARRGERSDLRARHERRELRRQCRALRFDRRRERAAGERSDQGGLLVDPVCGRDGRRELRRAYRRRRRRRLAPLDRAAFRRGRVRRASRHEPVQPCGRGGQRRDH